MKIDIWNQDCSDQDFAVYETVNFYVYYFLEQ